MTIDDVSSVVDYCADPLVRRHMYWGQGQPGSIERIARRTVAAQGQPVRTYYVFVITLKPVATPIGRCFLQNVISAESASLGWDLNRHYWGQGFAPEAAQAVLHFAFAEHNLRIIHAYCDQANLASVRVMEKLGMKCQTDGWRGWALGLSFLRFGPVVHYALTREMWQTMQPGAK